MYIPPSSNKYRELDFSYIIGSIEALSPYLRKKQIISLESTAYQSTAYPGTTDEKAVTKVKNFDFEVRKNMYVVFSLGRDELKNNSYKTATIPIIVRRYSNKCLEISIALYKQVVNKVVFVNSGKVSEIIKLLHTSYISPTVKILGKNLICLQMIIQPYMNHIGKNLK